MPLAIREDDIDVFFDLLEEETGEDHHSKFRIMSAGGQRLGQAFANSLPLHYRSALLSSRESPWQSNSWTDIFHAIDWLTS